APPACRAAQSPSLPSAPCPPPWPSPSSCRAAASSPPAWRGSGSCSAPRRSSPRPPAAAAPCARPPPSPWRAWARSARRSGSSRCPWAVPSSVHPRLLRPAGLRPGDEFRARHPPVSRGDRLRGGALRVQVVAVGRRGPVLRLLVRRHEARALRPQVHLVAQDLPHVVAVAGEVQRLRQRAGQDLEGIALLLAPEQVHHVVQVPQFVGEHLLPDLLDPRVALLLQATEVAVDLRRLVQEPLLQPGLVRILQRLVLRDVLLLDRGDLRVELPRHRVGVVV